MSLSKFCVAALLVLSTEAYKFEPLAAQPSPGTVGTAVPAAAAAQTRVAANTPIYDDTQLTAQNPLNPGHATQQGNAAAYTATTATVQPSFAGGAAGGALAAGVIQIRNGGQIAITYAANTGFTMDTATPSAAQSATNPKAGLYCAPGQATEMIEATQGVDCGANTVLMARAGAAKVGDQTFDATTASVLNFAPTTAADTFPANYNGRWLCWLGFSVGTAATTASACPTADATTMWQKVFSVGTISATPTPTPMYVSPSTSPGSASPTPSPTSGAAMLSSWLCLITTGAITLLWIQ